MEEYITHSRDETVALGRRLAAELAPGSLIAFTGGLGAGKTAFCQGIAEGLGCTDPVSSPTFAIVNSSLRLGLQVSATFPAPSCLGRRARRRYRTAPCSP